MALPSKPVEPTQREAWSVERYKASELPAVLRLAGIMKVTGSVTLNLSQGKAINLEVKTKAGGNGNGNDH